MPEDRAKLHALWAWRSEHCPSCQQRRSEWLDDDGKELRDPPYEIAEAFCPSCELLHDYSEGAKDDPRRPGTHPYFRHVDDGEAASGAAE